MADDNSKTQVSAQAPAQAQPQVVYVQQSSNQAAAPTEGLLQPKEGEKVFYIVRGKKVDPDGNPVR